MRSIAIVDADSHNRLRVQVALGAALLLIGLWAAQTQAQLGTVPESWEGVWDTTVEFRICGNPTVFGSDSFADSLCTGEVFSDVGGDCSGSMTDTSIDLTCTSTEELQPGCNVTITQHWLGTRNNNHFSVVETFETNYTGTCSPEFLDSCAEITATGDRNGDDPNCSNVATESRTWSAVKAKFQGGE